MKPTPEMIEAAKEKYAKHGQSGSLRSFTPTTECISSMLSAALALLPGEPVGEAGMMPASPGFTFAAFKISDVPVGTKLYASPTPPPSVDRDALLEEARRVMGLFISNFAGYKDGDGNEAPALISARSLLLKLEGSSHAKD